VNRGNRERRPVSRVARAAGVAAILLSVALVAGCAGTGTAREMTARAATGNAAAVGKTGTAAKSETGARSEAAAKAEGQATAAASCDPYASSLAPGGPATVSSGSFAAKIKARGYLIAGVDQTTYDFGFLNPLDNKIEGFDIDMVDAVAEAIFGPRYQSHLYLKAIRNADRLQDLENGSVDIVADTLTINCARLQQIDFSSVYYDAQAKLLVLKNSKAASLRDLAGQKVCAVTGADDIAIIQRYHATPVTPTYWTDCLVDLQQGQVAGIVTDDSILHGLAAQDPYTKIVGSSLEAEPYGLGISRQHPDFVRFVNAVLARIESGGQWQADYRQWIGTPVPSPPVPQYAS
jgi:polar amino acid transport system substrate-binding protein